MARPFSFVVAGKWSGYLTIAVESTDFVQHWMIADGKLV